MIIDELYTDESTGDARLPTSLDDNAWALLVDTTKRTLEVARRHGLRPVFHPHANTHVEYEAQIERLLEDIDDLELCFDFGHHAYCGGDAVPFFGRHRDRIPYLHLKSVDGDIRDRVAREGLSFSDAVAQGVFVEPSLGAVDYVALRNLIVESGYRGFAIVEQDMYPADPDKPYPIAKRTFDYLRGLGLS